MSNESDGSGKTAKAQPAKAADPKPAPAAPAKKDAEPLELEERRYSFEDLKRSLLVPDQLLAMLGDGRAHVRANAVLGLAASGQAVPQLVPVLRDSEAVAANAAPTFARMPCASTQQTNKPNHSTTQRSATAKPWRRVPRPRRSRSSVAR